MVRPWSYAEKQLEVRLSPNLYKGNCYLIWESQVYNTITKKDSLRMTQLKYAQHIRALCYSFRVYDQHSILARCSLTSNRLPNRLYAPSWSALSNSVVQEQRPAGVSYLDGNNAMSPQSAYIPQREIGTGRGVRVGGDRAGGGGRDSRAVSDTCSKQYVLRAAT